MYGVAAQGQDVSSISCLRVEGVVVDYATQKPLKDARLFVKLATSRMQISTTTTDGAFSGGVSCEAVALVVEKTGYRPQVLPLQLSALTAKAVAFTIPLVAADRQGSNRTYLQTEQTAFVQRTSQTDSSRSSGRVIQRGRFVVTDAIRNTPLQATVCFVYTKNGKRDCLETTSEGKLSIDFDQADIVAIEATSAGYQRYEGNLLIDSLDGRTATHPLKLQRELTILTIRADKATRCELRNGTITQPLMPVPGHVGWFSTYLVSSQPYELVAAYPQGENKQRIELNGGLNYKPSPEPKATTEPALAAGTRPAPILNDSVPVVLMDSLPMIYFEQSSYQLTTGSQRVLKQVAHYLKSHGTYTVQITGHTDNVGDERLNRSLSEYRAAVVATFLIRQGVTERQCLKNGYGSQQPIVSNDTEENKARNRRVSLNIISTE